MCTGAEFGLLAGAGLSLIGSVSAGEAAASSASDQASIKDEQAAAERQRTLLAVRRMRSESSRLAGQRRAAFAASGVETNTGTPLQVQQEAAADAEFEALLTEAQGERGARRLEQEAAALKKRGRKAFGAGLLKGGGSFITAGNGKLFNAAKDSLG